ncbi:MAG: hypothetical protein J6Y71_00980 [Ruminococcus sp.]|nr:hypothetical protein [Ruminococcus sp.]
MKNLFRKLAALSLTAVTMLAGCGDYLDVPDKPQEPTYSTLQVYTDPVTSEHVSDTTTARSTIASTARQTSTAMTTTAKQSTKSQKTTTKSSKTTAAVKTTEAVTTSTVSEDYVEYHFRSKKLLEQHFEKHGSEFKNDFGYKDASEYEKGASDVINNIDALHKTEKEDGDGIYYLVDSNEFVVLSTDGYIRTYFRPDSGKKYYDKQ